MKLHAVAIALAFVISSAASVAPQSSAPSAEQVALAQRAPAIAIAPSMLKKHNGTRVVNCSSCISSP